MTAIGRARLLSLLHQARNLYFDGESLCKKMNPHDCPTEPNKLATASSQPQVRACLAADPSLLEMAGKPLEPVEIR